jgi:ACS family sodium-dependent inorganic phosphate cotransporter-like MFS transporter 5
MKLCLCCFIGTLAERFGAKWVFGGGLLGAAILTLLTPIAAKTHVGLLILVRILIGIFEVNQLISSTMK